MDNDNMSEEGGLLQRIKESPRTVSALIIILIVAAAIYAFSGDDNNGEVALNTGEETATVEENGEEAVQLEEAAGDILEGETTTKQAAKVAGEETTAEAAKEIPKAERTEQGYVEVAQAGDGYTHLSRRAVTRWLGENQTNYAVGDEHRIYIEDYIQNRIGTQPLALGDSHTVSFDLIKEAVAAAEGLNEQQLQNLSQYTGALK